MDQQQQQPINVTYTATVEGDNYTAYSADAKYETSQDEATGTRTLVGYPIVWGATTDAPVPGTNTRHRFGRGSVEFTGNTYALFHHDYGQPLGDTDSGSLRLKPDIHGMRVEIDLPNTTAGNDTWELVKSGRVKGMSFGGTIQGTKYAESGVHDITKFSAREVTITPIPRFSATSITPKATADIQHAETTPTVETKSEIVDGEKERQHRLQKNKLANIRLALYQPGRASGVSGD